MPAIPKRLVLVALTLLAVASPATAEEYWPAGDIWLTIEPEESGLKPAELKAAVDYALGQNTLGVVVVRHGKLATEAYASNWSRGHSAQVASAGKSMLSVLAGMALDDGKFKSLDQPLADFVDSWRGTDKQKITVRQLLSMTSGLDPAGLKVRDVAGDQFELNAAAKLAHPPATFWQYNTPAYHLLFHLVAKATGERFEDYAERKLVVPLEMENFTWLTGKGDGGAVSYYSAVCSTRDMARFGLFALRGGRWQDRQLVRSAYFKESIRASQTLNPSYGFLWWENAGEGFGAGEAGGAGRAPQRKRQRFPGSPSDTFAALGAGSQLIMMVPSLDLVVVRQGTAPKDNDFAAQLLRKVIAAVK